MGYVIAIIVVLLLVAGFVAYLVLNASRNSGGAAPEDPSAEGSPAGIDSPDPSPLGDSAEHAGDQQEGKTVQDPESEPAGSGDDAKPRVGDRGPETAQPAGPETAQPASERLGNRPS